MKCLKNPEISLQLMDMAKESTSFNRLDRNEKNKISGCTSQAWVVVIKNIDDTFSISIDSDSQIVKGLLSILEKIFQDQKQKIFFLCQVKIF